ncbi:MAG: ribosome silencing factor [Balneolaceae bacterium]|jgi:ribosome-associated protein|nr:MAG: ribosome silencing factor [Balneolaceae bacterium]
MPTTSVTTSIKKKNRAQDLLIQTIAKALSGKKGENIVMLDLRKITTMADHFILCSGLSENHIKTLADEVIDVCREEIGERPWRKEGLDTKRWVVLDFVDVVVHIFREETRNYYGIERMWSDAAVTRYEDS